MDPFKLVFSLRSKVGSKRREHRRGRQLPRFEAHKVDRQHRETYDDIARAALK